MKINRGLFPGAAAILILCTLGSARSWADAPTTLPSPNGHITLHLKQAIAEDVFHEITRQSGVRFQVNQGTWDADDSIVPMDVNLDDVPFWPAVIEMCQNWKLITPPNYGSQDGRIPLFLRSQIGGATGSTPLPQIESQGIVVQIQRISKNKQIDYDTGKPQNNCQLEMSVYVDPAMHVQSASRQATVVQADDDLGNSLKLPVKNSSTKYRGNVLQIPIYQMTLPLNYPNDKAKKIADLKFSLTFRAVGMLQTVQVDDPLSVADTFKQAGEVSITIHSLALSTDNPNTYEMKLNMTRTGGTANDLRTALISAKLTDDKGHRIGTRTEVRGGGKNQFTLLFINDNGGTDPLPKPAHWEMAVPVNMHDVTVPFEASDLLLP